MGVTVGLCVAVELKLVDTVEDGVMDCEMDIVGVAVIEAVCELLAPVDTLADEEAVWLAVAEGDGVLEDVGVWDGVLLDVEVVDDVCVVVGVLVAVGAYTDTAKVWMMAALSACVPTTSPNELEYVIVAPIRRVAKAARLKRMTFVRL